MTDSRKVMIRGVVFNFSDKSPFVSSGVSVFAAIEYDQQKDRLRCHECGCWFASLANHIASGAHDLSVRQYKIKHGLNLQTSLVSKEGSSARSRSSIARKAGIISHTRNANPSAFNNNKKYPRSRNELKNEISHCPAQLSLKILTLARNLGRTPTTEEMKNIGIALSTILRSFKVLSLREAMSLLGLEPRNPGMRPASDVEVMW